MKTFRFFATLLVITLCAGFTSCSDDDDDNPIVGTWRSEVDYYGYSDSYTFNADGSGFWVVFCGVLVCVCDGFFFCVVGCGEKGWYWVVLFLFYDFY